MNEIKRIKEIKLKDDENKEFYEKLKAERIRRHEEIKLKKMMNYLEFIYYFAQS